MKTVSLIALISLFSFNCMAQENTQGEQNPVAIFGYDGQTYNNISVWYPIEKKVDIDGGIFSFVTKELNAESISTSLSSSIIVYERTKNTPDLVSITESSVATREIANCRIEWTFGASSSCDPTSASTISSCMHTESICDGTYRTEQYARKDVTHLSFKNLRPLKAGEKQRIVLKAGNIFIIQEKGIVNIKRMEKENYGRRIRKKIFNVFYH